MPAERVARLNAALNAVLRDAGVRERFERMVAAPTPGTPEAFAATIAEEWRRWQRFVATSGVKLDD
jgi:tripartite-type tricarboxylate transporter receptor subunit TctC